MFGFFKKLKEAKIAKIKAFQDQQKSEFIKHIDANKEKNSCYETMYIIFHQLDIDLMMLIRKYHLEIEFDFDPSVSYYEVQIVSNLNSENDFYLAVGTQEDKNTMLYQVDKELDIDHLSSKEIIQMIIDDIVTYHQNI